MQNVHLEEDLEIGFERISVHGCFEQMDFSTLSFPQSLELMENWLTCREICLLQLRNQPGVAVEQRHALEIVGCSEEEKNFFLVL